MTSLAVKTQPKQASESAPSKFLDFFRGMYSIRRFEETCGEHYTLGHIRGFLHLYIGQEATAVGAIEALGPDDYVVSHYRDHGHALARGMKMRTILAELFGKRTGSSKGKGGSMHLFDIEKHFMGGHAIVAAQMPLAVGLAFAQKYRGSKNITICFFGDGATSQGTYHEALNMAALWNLPLIFCLENNGFGMGTAIERIRAGGADIYKSVAGYNIDAVKVDGMDVLAVNAAVKSAVEKVRAGQGPFFVEAKTYRYAGHSLADGNLYRTDDEVDQWRLKDPLITFPKYLTENGHATSSQIEEVKNQVEQNIKDAIKFADSSLPPDVSELSDDIYA